jgi:serine 3-dehydrogenase
MSGTVFITGATAGIGEASARRFAAAGWRVIGTGRRRERLQRLAEELGESFEPIELDVRDLDAISALPGREVDVLINNAGLAPPMQPLQEADLVASLNVIDTNISGLVALTRKLLPGIVERKGSVLNMSSVAATYPYRGGAVYGASKAFVRQFSLDLRCDLHGTGVRVTSIEPGMIETEFTIVRTGGDKAASDALYADMNPMTAEDTADILFWIATQPPHININTIELMPVSQSFAGFTVARNA